MSTYTVKAGESLSSIARDQLGSMNRWREIASLNRLASTVIRPGQILQLPEDEIAEVSISQSYTPGYTGAPSTPTIVSPEVETLATPEIMQEVAVTGRRIDYTVLALLLFGGWLLFGGRR